jgi:hypothetical protein
MLKQSLSTASVWRGSEESMIVLSVGDFIAVSLLLVFLGWLLGTIGEENWWLVKPGLFWKLIERARRNYAE